MRVDLYETYLEAAERHDGSGASRRWRPCWWKSGIVDSSVVDEVVDHYETNVGPLNGAKVIARAWTDPEYLQRLLDDGTRASPNSASAVPRAT